MSVRVEPGDMLEVIPRLVAEGVLCDACVTDPPYHLTPTLKRFGAANSVPAQHGRDGAMARLSSGFMGQKWDDGDIAFRPETWATVATILRPGAFLLAFGGTRTHHRLICAIEDAGFVIQDEIDWIFGCLDEQTFVATADGVKPYHKTKIGDLVLCYDPATGEYSYQPILEVVEYDYDDTAYRLIGDHGEQVVSRNHRCIVERGGKEAFQFAETLEREARVPFLENLPELQAALSRVYEGTSDPQQGVQPRLCGATDRGGEIRRDTQSQDRLRAVWAGGARSPAIETPETSEGLLQPTVPGAGSRLTSASFLGERKRQAPSRQRIDGRAQSRMEGWFNVQEAEGGLRGSADPLCALSAGLPEYGAPRRLCDGTSISGRAGDWPSLDASGNSSPPRPQCDTERCDEPDDVRHERTTQGVRAWGGHKTAVVRVVPFRHVGKVWCLRVPTGAFVAVRNGIAFATGNSGFPKRKDNLKPAKEPICLAYKPGGARTMQVDECRVETDWSSDPTRRGWQGGATDSGEFGWKNGKATGPKDAGRWPANVIHDGSDEVLAAFPVVGNSHPPDNHGSIRNNHVYGADLRPRDFHPGFAEAGSAARFFMRCENIRPCDLCGLPWSTGDSIFSSCTHASNAEIPSAQPGTEKSSDFVQNNALGCLPQESADRLLPSRNLALNAEACSLRPPLPTPHTAQPHVEPWPLEKIVQNVRSAAYLCGSCATAIAQSLAATRLGLDPESPLSRGSIDASRKTILIHSLARYVAHRENTDTILTIESLRELFGSVFHAIAENINSERSGNRVSSERGPKRLHYSSKAAAQDRWGSHHPTVKPVELIRYLVKLICPPGGTFIDPFAGSGTAGVAALAEGRSAILIEREAEYLADIRERMAHYEGAGRHSLVSKSRKRAPAKPEGLFADWPAA